jgi:hypothetical protein
MLLGSVPLLSSNAPRRGRKEPRAAKVFLRGNMT